MGRIGDADSGRIVVRHPVGPVGDEALDERRVPPLAEGPMPDLEAEKVHAQAASAQGLTVYDGMLLGMVVVWAVNPAFIKWALGYVDPLVFNSLRFSLATLVLVGWVLLRGEGLSWHRGDGVRLFVLGLVAHGVYQVLFIIGINLTLAGNVALILSISPAFVAVFSFLLGYERARGYVWAGVGATMLGVTLVTLGTGERLELGSKLLGDFLTLVGTAIWSLYTVLSQSLLKRYSSARLNALTMPAGSLFLLVVASPFIANSLPTFDEVPATAWLVLVGSGLLAVSASYVIWYKGVQKLGATRTAIYSNLVPVLAAFVSYFVLNEPLGWQFWTGMAMVLGGVTLARFGGRLFARRRVSGV